MTLVMAFRVRTGGFRPVVQGTFEQFKEQLYSARRDALDTVGAVAQFKGLHSNCGTTFFSWL